MIINEIVQEEFTAFLASVPAKRLKHNIGTIVLLFIKRQHEIKLPGFMNDFLTDFILLQELLNTIDNEIDQSHLL